MISRKFNFLFSFITIILLLQLTDAYKLVLLVINKQTYVASIFTLICCCLFLIIYLKKTINLFRFKLFKLWFNLIFTLPAGITFIHFLLGNIVGSEFIRWEGIFILSGSLFASSTLMFSHAKSINKINRFFWSALVIVIIGMVVSLINYDFIRSLMALDRATENIAYINSVNERAKAFYDHPNKAARALLFISIILLGSYLYNKSKFAIGVFSALSLILIAFTGSRTALLLSFIFLALYLPRVFNKTKFSVRGKKGRDNRVIIYSSIPIIILGLILFFSLSLVLLDDIGSSNVASRFEFLTILTNDSSSSSLENDRSVQSRITVVFQYLTEIGDNIILGQGPALRNDYISKGIFAVASQNQFLEDAFAYGIFYSFYTIYVLFYSIKKISKEIMKDSDGFLYCFKIFLIVFVIYCFSVNYVFINTISVIVLGCFLGYYIKFKSLEIYNGYNI